MFVPRENEIYRQITAFIVVFDEAIYFNKFWSKLKFGGIPITVRNSWPQETGAS